MSNINNNAKSSASQCAQILAYLKKGKKLTSLEALEKFGCMRLASRILDLREKGYNIKVMTVDTLTGKRVSQYWLEEG